VTSYKCDEGTGKTGNNRRESGYKSSHNELPERLSRKPKKLNGNTVLSAATGDDAETM
jgi:hypothetical protein